MNKKLEQKVITIDEDLDSPNYSIMKGANHPYRGMDYDHVYRLSRSLIMMVDDEPINIDTVQAFLEEAGYVNFVTTDRSTEALAILEGKRPDILLLDLMMPEISGFDILASMRCNPELKHIPVIVLTANDDAGTKLKVLELGATDFLSKPVDASELLLRLRNTLSAKAYQDQLIYYDSLTGLPNRRSVFQHLKREVIRAQRDGSGLAILYIGLDRFKQFNDTLGIEVGDELIKEVAQRITHCYRETDYVGILPEENWDWRVSRLSGDEFSVVLSRLDRAEDAVKAVQRILAAVEAPIRVDNHELFVTVSVGIAMYPGDGDDEGILLKNAGSAMNELKQQSRGGYKFYSNEMNVRLVKRLSLESKLRKAIESDELMLFYQPKVDVRGSANHIKGVEALVRWHNLELGMVSPDEFIDLAEETGLIIPLGEWVLHAALQQIKKWQKQGLPPLSIAVNLSSHQFQYGALLETVQNLLQRSGVEPCLLEMEITESVAMHDSEKTMATLNGFKEMGLLLSMDDFGTGYSSLSYLKRFPLDSLKIDRTFIKDIPDDEDSAAITKGIILLSHTLDMKVVAEGVETKEQLDYLREQGCDEVQGYLFSKPVSGEELAQKLFKK